jgi:rhodanese-related sulfurtransferase
MTTHVHRDEIQKMVEDGGQLVEVLPAEAYEAEHLPGAISIPLKELAARPPRELDSARAVILYCYDHQ